MKNNKLRIIALVVLAIICIFALSKIHESMVLNSNNKQMDMLGKIYSEYCNENEEIFLAKSAKENFITHKEYKNAERLIPNNTDTEKSYIISVKYDKKNKILSVEKNSSNHDYFCIQRYKINVGFNKINFTEFGTLQEFNVHN